MPYTIILSSIRFFHAPRNLGSYTHTPSSRACVTHNHIIFLSIFRRAVSVHYFSRFSSGYIYVGTYIRRWPKIFSALSAKHDRPAVIKQRRPIRIFSAPIISHKITRDNGAFRSGRSSLVERKRPDKTPRSLRAPDGGPRGRPAAYGQSFVLERALCVNARIIFVLNVTRYDRTAAGGAASRHPFACRYNNV